MSKVARKGPKDRGTTERVDVRLTPEEAAALDAWRESHTVEGWDGQQRPRSRNEAMRELVRRICMRRR